jgi:hypothetical protein
MKEKDKTLRERKKILQQKTLKQIKEQSSKTEMCFADTFGNLYWVIRKSPELIPELKPGCTLISAQKVCGPGKCKTKDFLSLYLGIEKERKVSLLFFNENLVVSQFFPVGGFKKAIDKGTFKFFPKKRTSKEKTSMSVAASFGDLGNSSNFTG